MSKHMESKVENLALTLLGTEDFVTLDSLARKCELTSRSIQNYVKKLENWLLDNDYNNVIIIKKPGSGIKIRADKKSREDLKKAFSGFAAQESDTVKRRMEELNMLLFSDCELTIGFLADQFYTSRAAIIKDMEWIDGWLRSYNLKIFKIQHMGIGVSGDETSKRNALAAFSELYKPNRGLFDLDQTTTGRERMYMDLESLYPRINVGVVAKLIEEAEERFDFYLTNEYFSTLLTHLVICISRIKGGYETEECELNAGEFSSVIDTAKFIAGRIESLYRIHFPAKEMAYICLHLMGYAMRAVLEQEYLSKGNAPDGAEGLTKEIIEYVERHSGFRFSRDKLLYFGLLQHLGTAIYRIRNKLRINYLEEPETDPALRGVITGALPLYEKYCDGMRAPGEELCALTFHFMLSRNRLTQKARAVLLSSPGVLSGEILRKQLVDMAENLEIVDIVNAVSQVDWLLENRYDFIISFTDYEHKSKPVISLQYVKESNYREFLVDFIHKYVFYK